MDDSMERRTWLDKLVNFMEERRTPITSCPTISKNPLDLFRLYLYVKERGGFMEVCKVQCSSIQPSVSLQQFFFFIILYVFRVFVLFDIVYTFDTYHKTINNSINEFLFLISIFNYINSYLFLFIYLMYTIIKYALFLCALNCA